MPLFIDAHEIAGGVRMDDVAKAHLADLQAQAAHDVRYLRYWVDEQAGRVFCLVEAPSADAAGEVHRQAHGWSPTTSTGFKKARRKERTAMRMAKTARRNRRNRPGSILNPLLPRASGRSHPPPLEGEGLT